MNNEMVTLNKEETSRTILDWSHDVRCCSCSLWILLEQMTSAEEEREHALITLVTQTLEKLNKSICDFDTYKL
ncbi:hypothetical protein CJP72_18240 [Citrobacter sp. NCU1]|uniref:hypothetical protein n=1 Tax=Citrobacter sp. NCU1 TaxID=2026683 RepID=UPI001391D248|nr:hypothetical protein [Citrobacter sp. NCU1]NDO82641.1 hypothetical protein [Citrobacter sp. NCU1]